MHERSTNILFTSSNLLYSMIFARRCFLKEIMFQNITSSKSFNLAQTCCSDDQRLMDRWKHSLLTPIQRNVILS
ncbi:hypothetical protein T4B_8252 [Trichinella pseudospiralis]|uniref:Uncharacterized protein n=1 Tax=Trichinella pseudospiralis TaxID=6337 RepID=A0A0V1IG48_TRIPS|nr:hypothetical protein T4A_11545 [Trichinella pseudospiralis]KRZ21763.1 hypothetical protein T4B_8252 [Trichinella pseudospiralis]KRZ35247.1 hypothetical protein T4C_2352 [Trichinella pseudospiralis]